MRPLTSAPAAVAELQTNAPAFWPCGAGPPTEEASAGRGAEPLQGYRGNSDPFRIFAAQPRDALAGSLTRSAQGCVAFSLRGAPRGRKGAARL